MKKIKLNSILAFAVLSTVLVACKKDKPKPQDPPKNESELITAVLVKLQDSATGNIEFYKFSDPDGEGGNNPTQMDSIFLLNNKTYFSTLYFLDESGTKSDTINHEILEEAHEHLIVFSTNFSGMFIQILDKDNNNLPLGLFSKWKTLSTGNFKLKISLKHQPDIKDGSPEKGETDAEVDFNVKIE